MAYYTIGIDPGSNLMGLYALKFSRKKFRARPIKCCSFKGKPHPKGASWLQRTHLVSTWLRTIANQIALQTGENNITLAVEDYVYFGRPTKGFVNTIKIISGTIALLSAWPLVLYTPRSWRRLVRQFRENPDFVAAEEKARRNMPPQNPHEEDAFQIALCCGYQMQKGECNVL